MFSVSRIPPVPPGLGKPSTHSRNKRRRLKKGYEKEDATTLSAAGPPGPPKGSSLTNNLPLGQRKPKPGPSSHHPPNHTNPLLSAKPSAQLSSNSLDTSSDNNRPDSDVASALNNTLGINAQSGTSFPSSSILPENSRHENISESYTTPNQVMMSSLRNKNKKKGFKQSMANPLPQKIVFTTTNTTPSGSPQQPPLSAQDIPTDGPSTTSSGGTTTIQPRLIPPSEIQELGQLPSNMFVTSVDVESEIWGEHLPSSRKQGKKKQNTLKKGRYSATTTDWYDSSQMDTTFENGQFDDAHDNDDSSLTLPYFDTDIQTTTTTTTTQVPSADTTLGTPKPFDWDRVERLWKECAVLEKLEQLAVGCLVGWKVCNPCFFKMI